MGKIFGISDLPVSTIVTPFEPLYNMKPIEMDLPVKKQKFMKADSLLLSKKSVTKSNLTRCFGKLIKYFSKKI